MKIYRLTRPQMLSVLDGLTIWHDALVCHRDGSFTICCDYTKHSIMAETNLAKLTRYTKAHVIERRHEADAKEPYIRIRFAFIAE